ncbi:hypothetical protein GFK82_00152 [Candidatus Steffania adelgidicola]|nr:hypothetical protein GFK82_00152 [Candidatus Steffania adelgidicola]
MFYKFNKDFFNKISPLNTVILSLYNQQELNRQIHAVICELGVDLGILLMIPRLQ